ncbi:hypothetical protein FACS189447_02990 [Spirochaetia bacterium]|nr:hypothetical protein FACS189447_02990 [Spirochaetia bacterium]
MGKKNLALLTMLVFALSLTTCDVFLNKPENDLLAEIDAAVNYANAAYANISIGIIPGSLSAAPTETPKEKVGYPFAVLATANSGYGFSGWRVLPKGVWDSLDTQNPSFETDFIKASLSGSNTLAKISDTLGLDGKPSGGASITALTANPLVIVPYATLRPAIGTSYPAMNAYNIPYGDQVEIHFDAPITESSFEWQAGETPDFEGDIKNVTISAVKPDGTPLADYKIIEALFGEHSLSLGGDILRLTLSADEDELKELELFDIIDKCKITIMLGDEIERRGSKGVKIMPRQSLVYTVAKVSTSVDTRLSALTVIAGGDTHNFSSQVSTTLDFNISAYAAPNIKIDADAVQPAAVKISASGGGITGPAASPFSVTSTLLKGRSTITLMVNQTSGGAASTTYRLTVTNYPAQSAPVINTINGGNGSIALTWSADAGASRYEVRWGQGGDTYTISSGLSPGQTYNVWVRSTASNEIDDTVYYGPYSNVRQATTNSSTARLSGLTVGAGTLSPDFNSETFLYSVNVYNRTTAYAVTAGAQSGGSVKIGLNGATPATNSPANLTLAKGKNTVVVRVTPQNGGTAQDYTITVNNYPAGAPTLSTITPSVDSTTKKGKIALTWAEVGGADSYRILYGTTNNMDSLDPSGAGTATGTSYTISNLNANTTYYVFVQAVSGTDDAKKLYSVPGTGSATTPTNDARLAALSLSGFTFSPPFNPDLSDYEIVQDFPNTKTALTAGEFSAVPYSSGATLSISGSNSLAVKADGNTLTLRVTTQYNTTKDYKIKAYRKPTAPGWAPVPFSGYRTGGVDVNWTTAGVETTVTGYEVYQNTIDTYVAGGIPFPKTGQAQISLSTAGMTAENTYYYYVRSYTRDTTSNRYVYNEYNTVEKTLKTITTLDDLAVATHGLTGTFNPQNSSLETLINYTTANISVTPTYNANKGIYSVTVNGTARNTGQAQPIPLSFGSTNPVDESFWNHTPVTVSVTAQHPNYTRVYNLGVTRRGIKIGAGSGNAYTSLDAAFNDTNNNNVVYLATDQIIPLTAAYNINSGTKTIRPRGSGGVTITAENYSAFVINGGATLNLGGANSTGTLYIEPADPSLEYPEPLIMLRLDYSQGTLNMYNNVHVRNRKCRKAGNWVAAGVQVESGTFNMYGGSITNNQLNATSNYLTVAGGVSVSSGSEFNGYGGYITNNTANRGSTPNLYPATSKGDTIITP